MIRILKNILLLGVLVALFFVYKNEIKNTYTKVASYTKETLAPLLEKEEMKLSPEANSQLHAIATSVTKTIAKKTPVKVNTPSPLKAAQEYVSGSSSYTLSVQGVISYTNQNRKENGGLAGLTENAQLDHSAQLKLQDMFDKQYFEHVSPSGVGITNLADTVGYQYIVIGENLALGDFEGDKGLVDAWMASPGHRANILNSRYTEIGVAVGRGMYQGRNTWLAVQHFGMPQSACPKIDNALKAFIDASQKDLKSREAELTTRKKKIDSGESYEGMNTNQQIAKYNELVAQYNTLITETKKKITTYNTQVSQYNACIGSEK